MATLCCEIKYFYACARVCLCVICRIWTLESDKLRGVVGLFPCHFVSRQVTNGLVYLVNMQVLESLELCLLVWARKVWSAKKKIVDTKEPAAA